VGPERNAPNTIHNSCADGNSGTYRNDESLDRIRISTLDGSPFAPGKTVRVDMTVWAWSTGSSDSLDIYYTGDANSPTWTYLTTLKPPSGGAHVLSATYTLPQGSLQAVRGNFRYSGTVGSCTTGSYDDRDDLVFATGSSGEPRPPSASFTSSCTHLGCGFTDTSSDPDGDIASWSWSFGDGATSSERNPSHAYALGGDYTVSLTVTDSTGLSSTFEQTVSPTDPIISLSAHNHKVKNDRAVDLTWSNAPGTHVNVFRDGVHVATTENDGFHTDDPGKQRSVFVYRVCEVGTSVCSEDVTVVYIPD
jgi:aqualysin 1